MKKGEKAALWVAGGLMAAIGALTMYLESQVDPRNDPLVAKVAEGQLNQTHTPTPTQVATIPQGLNPYDLPDAGGHGASLMLIYCMQCHDLPSPAMHTQDEWPAVVTRMEQHIRSSRGGMLARIAMPSKSDWTDLGQYLHDHGQIPLNSADYDDLGSPEGQQFQTSCNQCHGAPDPKAHKASEWPRTVLRMKQHMGKAGKDVPDNAQTEQIVGYLQRHAKVAAAGANL